VLIVSVRLNYIFLSDSVSDSLWHANSPLNIQIARSIFFVDKDLFNAIIIDLQLIILMTR